MEEETSLELVHVPALILLLLVTIIDFFLKLLLATQILLVLLRLARDKVALHCLFGVVLDLLDLLSEVLSEERELVPQPLHYLLLDLDLILTELLDLCELVIGLLFDFIYLVIEGIVIRNEALAILLFDDRDEVVRAVRLLQRLPNPRRIRLFLGAAAEDLHEAQIGDRVGIRTQFVHQLDLVLQLVDVLNID